MSVLFLSMPIRPMCRRFLWTSCWSVWRKNRKLNWRKKRAGTAKLSSWSLVGPSRGLNYHILFIFTLMSKLACIQDWNYVGKWFYISLQNCLGPRSMEQRRSASAWVLATTGGKFIRYVHYVWYVLYICSSCVSIKHFSLISLSYTLPTMQSIVDQSCNCMPPSHLIQILSFAERQNEYYSQEEFWVTVKETGKKIESTSYSEIQTQEREAPIL